MTLQLVSFNCTPPVLRIFTQDRGVQAVLDAYIAAFLCSLLVFADHLYLASEGMAFDPVVSMTLAVVVAILCVTLLVYFIAHIVSLIQCSAIVKMVHKAAYNDVAPHGIIVLQEKR